MAPTAEASACNNSVLNIFTESQVLLRADYDDVVYQNLLILNQDC